MASHTPSEVLADALVREYLKRKSLTRTLAVLEEERPRRVGDISSRTELVKQLGVGKLVSANKAKESSQKTLLELIADYLHSRTKSASKPSTPTTDVRRTEELSKAALPAKPVDTTSRVGTHRSEALDLEDVDEVERTARSVRLTEMPISTAVSTKLLDACDYLEPIYQLMFGANRGRREFGQEWHQGFSFTNTPNLRYGLVQHKGGPCGVLACVQAFILKDLIFTGQTTSGPGSFANPEDQRRKVALVNALSEILMHIQTDTGERMLVLPAPSLSLGRSSTMEFGIRRCRSADAVRQAFSENISAFEGRMGILAFLFSAVLTRGIDNIKADMDDASSTLIGRHGYCTQELVNLLLTGRAVSNVFDNEIVLDKMRLKGISAQATVGFLTLLETYKNCKVGEFLKSPRYPIWVVCSESHYTVLFAEAPPQRRFELFYYDGLAHQDEVYRLSIVYPSGANEVVGKPFEDDLTPPLEHVIRTKWENASVSWNGSDPLL